MAYLTAWLSLIGWGEAALFVGIVALCVIADRLILWHDKHSTWRGLLNR